MQFYPNFKCINPNLASHTFFGSFCEIYITLEYLEEIQKVQCHWHKQDTAEFELCCNQQWQLWECRCCAHLVSCHRGRKPTCLWARTGSPPAALPARGAPLACSHTGDRGQSVTHRNGQRNTFSTSQHCTCLSASTHHRLPAWFHPVCPNPALSYSNSRVNPHSWSLNLQKLLSD